MKEFDTTKGAFMLVAMVIATMMIIVLIAMGTCGFMIIYDPRINPGVCETMREPIMQLFQMSFTAAIAFAGGRMSAGHHIEPPMLPPERKAPPKPKPPATPPPAPPKKEGPTS